MTLSAFIALLPLLASLAGTQAEGGEERVRRVTVHEQLILRVPVQPRPPLRRFEWEERKGPKCISTGSIRGALLSGADNVDFLLIARQRVRANFDDDCPALDFYGGFYLKPTGDRICAGRDFIHSRIGGSCRIEGFRHLIPKGR